MVDASRRCEEVRPDAVHGVAGGDGDGPVRTCVGCRGRCRDVELLRVVVADGVLTPDPRRRLPGRGAWVHPDAGCVAMARQRRAFDRAFPGSVGLDVAPLARFIGEPGGGVSASRTSARNDQSTSELGNEVDPS